MIDPDIEELFPTFLDNASYNQQKQEINQKQLQIKQLFCSNLYMIDQGLNDKKQKQIKQFVTYLNNKIFPIRPKARQNVFVGIIDPAILNNYVLWQQQNSIVHNLINNIADTIIYTAEKKLITDPNNPQIVGLMNQLYYETAQKQLLQLKCQYFNERAEIIAAAPPVSPENERIIEQLKSCNTINQWTQSFQYYAQSLWQDYVLQNRCLNSDGAAVVLDNEYHRIPRYLILKHPFHVNNLVQAQQITKIRNKYPPNPFLLDVSVDVNIVANIDMSTYLFWGNNTKTISHLYRNNAKTHTQSVYYKLLTEIEVPPNPNDEYYPSLLKVDTFQQYFNDAWIPREFLANVLYYVKQTRQAGVLTPLQRVQNMVLQNAGLPIHIAPDVVNGVNLEDYAINIIEPLSHHANYIYDCEYKMPSLSINDDGTTPSISSEVYARQIMSFPQFRVGYGSNPIKLGNFIKQPEHEFFETKQQRTEATRVTPRSTEYLTSISPSFDNRILTDIKYFNTFFEVLPPNYTVVQLDPAIMLRQPAIPKNNTQEIAELLYGNTIKHGLYLGCFIDIRAALTNPKRKINPLWFLDIMRNQVILIQTEEQIKEFYILVDVDANGSLFDKVDLIPMLSRATGPIRQPCSITNNNNQTTNNILQNNSIFGTMTAIEDPLQNQWTHSPFETSIQGMITNVPHFNANTVQASLDHSEFKQIQPVMIPGRNPPVRPAMRSVAITPNSARNLYVANPDTLAEYAVAVIKNKKVEDLMQYCGSDGLLKTQAKLAQPLPIEFNLPEGTLKMEENKEFKDKIDTIQADFENRHPDIIQFDTAMTSLESIIKSVQIAGPDTIYRQHVWIQSEKFNTKDPLDCYNHDVNMPYHNQTITLLPPPERQTFPFVGQYNEFATVYKSVEYTKIGSAIDFAGHPTIIDMIINNRYNDMALMSHIYNIYQFLPIINPGIRIAYVDNNPGALIDSITLKNKRIFPLKYHYGNYVFHNFAQGEVYNQIDKHDNTIIRNARLHQIAEKWKISLISNEILVDKVVYKLERIDIKESLHNYHNLLEKTETFRVLQQVGCDKKFVPQAVTPSIHTVLMFDNSDIYRQFDMVTGTVIQHNRILNPDQPIFNVSDLGLPVNQQDKRVISIIIQYKAVTSRNFGIKPWFNVVPYSKFYYEGLIGKKTFANTHLTIGFDGFSDFNHGMRPPLQNSAFPHMAQAYRLQKYRNLDDNTLFDKPRLCSYNTVPVCNTDLDFTYTMLTTGFFTIAQPNPITVNKDHQLLKFIPFLSHLLYSPRYRTSDCLGLDIIGFDKINPGVAFYSVIHFLYQHIHVFEQNNDSKIQEIPVFDTFNHILGKQQVNVLLRIIQKVNAVYDQSRTQMIPKRDDCQVYNQMNGLITPEHMDGETSGKYKTIFASFAKYPFRRIEPYTLGLQSHIYEKALQQFYIQPNPDEWLYFIENINNLQTLVTDNKFLIQASNELNMKRLYCITNIQQDISVHELAILFNIIKITGLWFCYAKKIPTNDAKILLSSINITFKYQDDKIIVNQFISTEQAENWYETKEDYSFRCYSGKNLGCIDDPIDPAVPDAPQIIKNGKYPNDFEGIIQMLTDQDVSDNSKGVRMDAGINLLGIIQETTELLGSCSLIVTI